MSEIVFESVSKSYAGHFTLDLDSLVVPDRGLTVLCGPPASGKSVILRLLVGLEQPDRGRILLDGVDVTSTGPARRRVGYVPQSFALFPHMSVFENIAFPLRMQRVVTGEVTRRVGKAAEILRIGKLLAKSPSQLSGGEKQRVAIARGMLKDATVFVLDDPLVGLDFKLREALMDDLKDMRSDLGATFLYATSDSLEALTMAERIAVIDAGRIVEEGDVDRIYHQPQRLRSAELIGFPRCNILAGQWHGAGYVTELGSLHVRSDGGAAPPDMIAVAIRPEQVVFSPDGTTPGSIAGRGRITLVENLGAESVVHFDAGTAKLVSIPPSELVAHLDVGDPFPFAVQPSSMVAFNRTNGRRPDTTAGAPASSSASVLQPGDCDE